MRNNKNTQEDGRSIVEMLGVLAIIGVLSVGGIAGYSQAMSKYKVTKAMDQVQSIMTNARTLYASQRTFSVLTPQQAQSMGILTEESVNGTKGLNPFGGEIKFGVGSANRSFTLEYSGLTAEACVKMATADWGADESSGLLSITIKDTGTSISEEVFTWKTNSALEDALPVKISAAAKACGIEQKGAIIWEYR